MVMYVLYNEYLKKYYTEDKSNPKGYNWVDFEFAKTWRTENGRSKAYSVRKMLLNEQSFSKLEVQKYELRQIKDV